MGFWLAWVFRCRRLVTCETTVVNEWGALVVSISVSISVPRAISSSHVGEGHSEASSTNSTNSMNSGATAGTPQRPFQDAQPTSQTPSHQSAVTHRLAMAPRLHFLPPPLPPYAACYALTARCIPGRASTPDVIHLGYIAGSGTHPGAVGTSLAREAQARKSMTTPWCPSIPKTPAEMLSVEQRGTHNHRRACRHARRAGTMG